MPRNPLLLLIVLVLASGCSDDSARPEVSQLLAEVQAPRLAQHIERLLAHGPRANDSTAIRHALDYIRSRLEQYGYQPYLETIPGGGVNLLAERRLTGSDRFMELAAHYDTTPDTPGADDNASAVAALLEVARLLAGVRPDFSVRFCFFAREETDRGGSREHVRRLAARDEPLLGVIVLEMVGYSSKQPGSQDTPLRIPLLFDPPDTGNFIAVAGNLHSGGLGNRLERAIDRHVPELPYFSANRLAGFLQDGLRSDHSSYWDGGYRAIMLTDTADFRNPHYHSADDLPETLDFGFLQNVTRAVLASLLLGDQALR